MKQTVLRGFCSRTALFCLAFGIAGAGFSQATPAPAATAAPTPAAASSPEAASSMMEPVRQAIANQDYDAASRALETIRQQDPNNPHIAVYENIIQSRRSQPSTIGLRTPRAGVTPGPTPEATPTPVPTPVATPSVAPATAPADEGIAGKAKDLLKNQNVLYGVIALAVLIVLAIIFIILKKRKAAREMEAPIQASSMGGSGLGGLEDYSGAAGDTGYDSLGGGAPAGGGLGGASAVPDFTSPASSTPSAYGETTESPGMGLGAAGALGGGGGLAGGLSGYTVPTFGTEEEEESTPPPPRNLRPAPKPEEDDRPVSLTDEEPQAPAPAPLSEPTSPLSGVPEGEGLGINFDALAGVEDQPPAATGLDFAQPDEETVIVSPTPGGAVPTPTSTPSVDAGTVDLSDIFGEQAPPQKEVPFSEQPTLIEPSEGEDEQLPPLTGGPTAVPFSEQPTLIESEEANSETLPTFVAGPGVENPEEDVQIPPKSQRPEKVEEDHTISFEELFGSQGMPAAEPDQPAAAPAPAPKEEPLSKPSSEISIEEALAATLGAMQAESPDEPQAPAASAVTESSESLDERSERMFREQMDKARKAYDEKNWRQAVHFLSIASALHPENDEARQMLKEARTEKRKAEESV